MANTHSNESNQQQQFIFGRPIYKEENNIVTAQYPHETIHDRRSRIASQLEALTLLIGANDGEDFNSMADPFQLEIKNLLHEMATELHALCESY